MTAVTGACMVLRRACFDEVGGFDEIDLPVAYNDIDLCLKLRQKGYRIVYDADAELLHHESMSRGYDHQTEERRQRQQKEMALMLQRWGDALDRDPYYNRTSRRSIRSPSPFRRGRPSRGETTVEARRCPSAERCCELSVCRCSLEDEYCPDVLTVYSRGSQPSIRHIPI